MEKFANAVGQCTFLYAFSSCTVIEIQVGCAFLGEVREQKKESKELKNLLVRDGCF